MAGSIICGVDDSESAKGAARVARGLSSKLGLGLVFVCVVEDGAPEPKTGAIAERLERISGGSTEVDSGAGAVIPDARGRRAIRHERGDHLDRH